jgi:hypothetical protein
MEMETISVISWLRAHPGTDTTTQSDGILAWIRIVRQNHRIIESDEVVDSYPTPTSAFERLQAKVEELRKTEPTLTKEQDRGRF